MFITQPITFSFTILKRLSPKFYQCGYPL